MIKIIAKKEVIIENKFREIIERRKTATMFMWIPGIKPVIVPIRIPKNNAMVNSINT